MRSSRERFYASGDAAATRALVRTLRDGADARLVLQRSGRTG